MSFLRTLVAPVEFSDRCAAAVSYAGQLASHLQAELVLLHVLAEETGEKDYQERARRVAVQLEGFLREDLTGISVRRILIKGDPARKIVQFAQDEHAGAILMATRGFGPFRRFLLGSNTAKVLHDADCPVWTGAHLEEPATGFSPVRRILCAVDLGPLSTKVLTWAAALQREFHARLAILHCTPAPASVAKGAQSNWNVVVRGAAEEELEQLRESSGADAELLLDAGDPAQVIAAAAERMAADVVVIGRGSAAGVFGRLRANAYAIIRQSPCPVVSV